MRTTLRHAALAAVLLTALPVQADPAATAPPASSQGMATPMTFHSETVELPVGDRTFPGGAKADAINANCVTCHSAGMVLNQPALTRTEWTGEVHKMANVYKAPVSAEDQETIIDYLAETRGKR